MKAKLVHDSGSQRFYELSEPIFDAPNKLLSIEQLLKEAKGCLKPEFKHLIAENQQSWDMICISDAHTHIERLVFLGICFEQNKYARLNSLQIDGKYTIMIHGGNPDAVYDDKVYLRRIAMANKLIFEGIEK